MLRKHIIYNDVSNWKYNVNLQIKEGEWLS
jgi:hypothetical protein